MRKAFGKRIAALCAAAVLFTGALPAMAADTEARLLTGVFKSPVRQEEITWQFPYGDAYFDAPATVYRHELAQSTLGLALSSFRSHKAELSRKDEHVRAYLAEAGFDTLVSEQFDLEPTDQTIATMIGRKEISTRDGEATLIAVGVSGGGYRDEWLSNFSFGEEDYHSGFYRSANEVVRRVKEYLAHYVTEGAVKIWMGGYSRAAAVSNLSAHMMLEDGLCAPEDLYAYTFATPNCTRIAGEGCCPSIFNIVGPFDPVPSVPFAEWGYGRFGTTLHLPAQETDSDYAAHRAAVEPLYLEMTGIPFWNNTECNWFLQKICQMMYAMVRTSADYQSSVQDVVKRSWQTKGSLYRRLRDIVGILSESSSLTGKLEESEAGAEVLFSVFLYDFVMQKLGWMDSQWRHDVSFAVDLMHEHCPDVYVAWMFSQSDPEALFIKNTGYRRVFLAKGLEATVYDTRGIAAYGVAVEKIGEGTMLSIPADKDYVLRLTAQADMEAEMYLDEYNAGYLNARTLIYPMVDMNAGESMKVVLPSTLGAPMEHSFMIDANGDSVPPYFDMAYEEGDTPVAEFDAYFSGDAAMDFLQNATAAVIAAGCLLAASVIALPVGIVVKRRRKAVRARRAQEEEGGAAG